MKRRLLLQWAAGLALGSLSGARVLAKPAGRIIVVGGGIVGASVAYHLARRGAEVTLLEKSHPAAGASGPSFAWINANYTKVPRDYQVLSGLGVLGWHRLRQQVGEELPVRFGGTLEWYANAQRADELDRGVRQQQAWGYTVELLDTAGFARREPAVQAGRLQTAAFSGMEGAVDSAQATRLMLREAAKAGAQVLHPCTVEGIQLRKDGRVVVKTATRGEFEADRVVLAGGVDTSTLGSMAGIDVPLKPSPGIVVRSTPQPQMVQGVLATEDTHFHQQADGRVVMGDDYSPPERIEFHRVLAQRPQDFPLPELKLKHGQRIRGQAARYLPALATAEIESVQLCWRPLPQDDHPILGFAPGSSQLYVTVTHSGVTLAPIIGELAAIELLDGVKVDLLAPFRLERFKT